MPLIVDSREQSKELKAAADEVKLLSYPNPSDPGHPYSYDLEVHTYADQVIRFERKLGRDMLNSFDKISRQLAPVEALLLEGWNPKAWLLAEVVTPTFLESVEKRLFRLGLEKAILYTRDVQDTLVKLRYLEGKTEPLPVRGGVGGPPVGDAPGRMTDGPLTPSREAIF